MAVVKYTNTKGYKQYREVPDNTDESDFGKGILIGPPDLSSVPLSEFKRRQLNNILFSMGLLTYKQLSGNRGRLVTELVKDFKMSKKDAALIRNWIVSIYQNEEYGIEE